MPRRPLQVKHNHRPREGMLRVWFGVLRFVLYGFVGIAAEVFFYTLVKVGRTIPVVRWLFAFEWRVDDRLGLNHLWDPDLPLRVLFGQCSLWMFPVYAGACMLCVEPAYRLLARRPWPLRALVYGLGILVFEELSGWVLRGITGYDIWVYKDPFNVFGMTSLAIGPVWMATGMLIERIYRELMDPKVAEKLESFELGDQSAVQPTR